MYSYCYVRSVLCILFSSCQLALFGLLWLRFFRAFSSVVRQMPGYNSQRRGTVRTFPKLIVLFVYCLCVNVYCTIATGCQTNFQLTNTELFEMIVGILTTCLTQYTWDRIICIFYLIEQHSEVLLHTLQVLSAASYSWFSRTLYELLSDLLPLLFCHRRPTSAFPFTHAPYLLKLCIPPWNGIVRWCLFSEIGAELPLDNCNCPTFMKYKHTKRLVTAVRRHLSKPRSKRRNT